MESWDSLVDNYSRVVDLHILCKVISTATLTLQNDLEEIEAERLTTTFLFHPISALDLVRFLEEDSVWTKPLCDIFKVIAALIDKYPSVTQKYYDQIVVACNTCAIGRARSAALQCLRAVTKHMRVALPRVVTEEIKTEPSGRIQRALLLGMLCEMYPESVTDVEDICDVLLDLLASTNYSDSVSEAALRSIAQVLRHFSSDIPSRQLVQIHRHLARHIYCKRCREVVLKTVEDHAASLGACAAQTSALRVRTWTRPAAAAALYCALLPHASDSVKQKIITDEILPRVNNPRSGVRGAARHILTAAGHHALGRRVPGCQWSEDVHALRLRLLAGSIDYETADAIWWCIENKLEASKRLLDGCVCAHSKLPPITRRRILARAFYASPTGDVLRRIDMVTRNIDQSALQRFEDLCSELFSIRDSQQQKEQLLNLLISTLLLDMESWTNCFGENYVIGELPSEQKYSISQMNTVLSAAKSSRLSVNKAIISRLTALRCRGAIEEVEDLKIFVEAQCDELGAGDAAVDTRPTYEQLLARLKQIDGTQYCIYNMNAVAKYFLTDPALLSGSDAWCDVTLLYHVTRWSAASDDFGAAEKMTELLDSTWPIYVRSQGTSSAIHLLGWARKAVKKGGVVAGWAAGLLADDAVDIEDKAEVLAALSDDVSSAEAVSGVEAEITSFLPARLSECLSSTSARALLALLGAARGKLLDVIVALAAGPSEAGWWESVLAKGLGTPRVELLRVVFDRVFRADDPLVAGKRLLLPFIGRATEESRSQLFSEALPTLVSALRRAKHAKQLPRALLSLRVILLMMETMPAAQIPESSWRYLRDVCALCVTLRNLHANLPDTLVFHQTSYAVLSAVLTGRGAPARACAPALGPAAWGPLLDDTLPHLPLPEPPLQVTDRSTAFSEDLVEDSRQYDLFGDGPSIEHTKTAKVNPAPPWHPSIAPLTSLLRHLAAGSRPEDGEGPAWFRAVTEGLKCGRVVMRWMVAQAICCAKDALKPYTRCLVPALLSIIKEEGTFNSLHLAILDCLIWWGLDPQWALTPVARRLATRAPKCAVSLSRLAAVLHFVSKSDADDLLTPLLVDEVTSHATCMALHKEHARAPLPALLQCLHTQHPTLIILELIANAARDLSGSELVQVRVALESRWRHLRAHSAKDCLRVEESLTADCVGEHWRRWSLMVREQLGPKGKRTIRALPMELTIINNL